ncbi:efflux RND transporter permease subunit [Mucilaginibacter humi]|uniref:efflux RND transporter permease subunit n=1 Tax=Mucilaginibacter humi TaxID=2732510 RepID=UPI00293BE59A|nr:efflux RND transporter permease subunit [Mucilaginibacter humi]
MVFDIDRERANREGINSQQISMALFTSIYGMKAADFRNTKEDNYEINIRAQENQRNNIDAIRNLKITYRDMATGGAVRRYQYRPLQISGIPIPIVILNISSKGVC